MTKKNIVLLCGGGGSEHDVSIISSNFIASQLKDWDEINLYHIEICKDGARRDQEGNLCELRKNGELVYPDKSIRLDFAIAYMHGYPAETGNIQSIFEMMDLPYLGCSPEASILCFNKISTKLWLETLQIPNTPFCFLSDMAEEQLSKAVSFYKEHKDVYVKASSQGSSVGCFHCSNQTDFEKSLKEAFSFSDYVLVEKTIKGRELEMSVYESNDQIYTSYPGEIICPNEFYTFEEKYSEQSNTTTTPKAKGLKEETVTLMKQYATRAFKGLKLKHLSRMDFFLSDEGEIYLNEINTLPGLTPISLFPLMMEQNGHSFEEWLKEIIQKESR